MRGGKHMGLLYWIIFGALVGWLSSMVMNTGGGILWDIIMGVLGALIGGFLMSFFGQPGITGFNIYSVIVAVIGSCVLIYLSRKIRRVP
jgi:uncharacterized membrane protein YeaQ/YmgE (transglycosylase-associated protein family)